MEEATETPCCPSDERPQQSNPDFIPILTGGIFTFFIGEEAKRFDVHILALKQISRPLSYMMTNKKMEESIESQASLVDVDPTTFGMLVEYAYKGLCGVSLRPPFDETKAFVPFEFHCHNCGLESEVQSEDSNTYPFCSSSCEQRYLSDLKSVQQCRRGGTLGVDIFCVADGESFQLKQDRVVLFCDPCLDSGKDKHFPPYSASSRRTNIQYSKCGTPFSQKAYGCDSMTHEELADHMSRHHPKANTTNVANVPILQHAKLYALATQYMVPDLPEICLHKLHAQLLTFEVSDTTIKELVELLLYTYENTSEDGSILDGTGDKLRDLVIRYVVDRAKDVMQYEEFRHHGMLGAGGAPSADFMAVIYGKTTS